MGASRSAGQWRCIDHRMAQPPEGALELMEAVWPAAIARVREEVADMQALADAEGTHASTASRARRVGDSDRDEEGAACPHGVGVV